MKILMLSTDENIFKEGSDVRGRMIEYGKLVEELHIIVFTARNFQFPISNFQTNPKFQISKNTFIYPVFSCFKLFCFFSAYKIASKIIVNCKLKIDNCVVTTQDPFGTGLIGYLLKKKFKIPLQIQIHTDFLSPYFWRESVKNKLRVLVAKRIILSANNIRVVSERVKESLKARSYKLQANVTVLPVLVDIEKIRNSPVRTDLHQKYPGKFIILMASRLTCEKNIGLAMESVKTLASKYPNTLLLIVGSGPELKKLQVKSCKLQANTVFEPWSDDLVSYYKTADLFLLTSNYEGYGRTVIEAAAAGLPVLMTDVGIAIGDVFPVGDGKTLTLELGKLISSKEARESVKKEQSGILREVPVKSVFFNRIQQSWQDCFS